MNHLFWEWHPNPCYEFKICPKLLGVLMTKQLLYQKNTSKNHGERAEGLRGKDAIQNTIFYNLCDMITKLSLHSI